MSGSKAIDIIEALKATILNGGFDVSKPLPSAAALMKKFGVARGTVDRAMRELEHAGIVERRKGSSVSAESGVSHPILPSLMLQSLFLVKTCFLFV